MFLCCMYVCVCVSVFTVCLYGKESVCFLYIKQFCGKNMEHFIIFFYCLLYLHGSVSLLVLDLLLLLTISTFEITDIIWQSHVMWSRHA